MDATETPQSLPRQLPRGPHGLDPEVVAASQRVRILEAIAELVARDGYAAVRVADVIQRAGVSRRTFYEHFGNKEDAFLAAFDHFSSGLVDAVLAAADPAAEPRTQLRDGYAALLGYLSAHPGTAKAFTVVAPEAGRAAQDRRAEWREASILRLQVLYADAAQVLNLDQPELPEHIARATVGAVDALIQRHVETQSDHDPLDLLDAVTGVAELLMFGKIEESER